MKIDLTRKHVFSVAGVLVVGAVLAGLILGSGKSRQGGKYILLWLIVNRPVVHFGISQRSISSHNRFRVESWLG